MLQVHKNAGVVVVLFACLIVTVTGTIELIGPSQTIEAVVGDDVILLGQVEPPMDVTHWTVEWNRGDFSHIVHLYRHRQDDAHDQEMSYRGRTSLDHKEMTRGNVSLRLSRVQLSDAGRYTCLVRGLRRVFKKVYIDLRVVNLEDKGSSKNQTDESRGWTTPFPLSLTAKTDEPGGEYSTIDIISIVILVGLAILVAVIMASILTRKVGLMERLRGGNRREQHVEVNNFELDSLGDGAEEQEGLPTSATA